MALKKIPPWGSDERFLYSLNSDFAWKKLSEKTGKVSSGPVPDSANDICIRVSQGTNAEILTAPWSAIKDITHIRFGGYDNGSNFSALINISSDGITIVRAYMGSTSDVSANVTTTVYYR